MNTKALVTLSLLVGVGAVLHTVVPPIIFGVKPDMLLSMMFLGILLFPTLKYVAIVAIVTGIVSALTTTAPGGQIANLIDKPITAVIFLLLYLLLKNRLNNSISAPLLTAVGTMISGAIFLSVALFIIGLMDGSFLALFGLAVLPAALLNTIIMAVVFPIVQRIIKRSQPLVST
ncbi:MAG: tryptophan transporter [Bacillota bacterium]|uniref:Tryptophan transporter n=1 Tax=Virgibacillus salarius TaxID=447199 RepID=A0A941DUU0_9BACI|nr:MULTISPECIES: tryptophan transporter [Virgibacillus]MBR7797080.1 tryptophan transporter [Virgibacillus salarius]MCC2250859.1 tryptophan transporter [Virgibacillus sp. AGTR]NAZ09789.1 tryptophan transporter [Agaribacter marinus]QRZ16466.1 tryptophan transporter [Virgibacillus sp. AGTR]